MERMRTCDTSQFPSKSLLYLSRKCCSRPISCWKALITFATVMCTFTQHEQYTQYRWYSKFSHGMNNRFAYHFKWNPRIEFMSWGFRYGPFFSSLTTASLISSLSVHSRFWMIKVVYFYHSTKHIRFISSRFWVTCLETCRRTSSKYHLNSHSFLSLKFLKTIFCLKIYANASLAAKWANI